MTPPVHYLQDDEGNRVAYTVYGRGPDLVLPAWWISHAEKDWEHPSYRAFLEELGNHFTVIRYDRPGVGLSDRDVAPRSLESEVRLLQKIVAATTSATTVSLFAFSCGCPVGLAYAARNPGSVDKICIYGGYAAGSDIATSDVRAAVVGLVRAHWGAGSRALADIFLPDQPKEELDAASRQQRDSASARTAADLLELTYDMDVTEILTDVEADLLVLHRSGDRAIPSDAGRRLASSRPGVPFVILKGRAHPPWIGDRASILERLVQFILDKPYEQTNPEPADEQSLRLDVANRCLINAGNRVPLTPLEFAAMRYLLDNADRVVDREELLEHVWKTPFAGSNKVDVLIRALRKKLGAAAESIETVAGHGYAFRLSREPKRK